jgi:drug/metabolite transporter (DMT)-like permease
MWALQFLTAGLERIVLFSYPLFVVIIRVFQGQGINRVQLLGLVVAYLGVRGVFLQDIQLHENTSVIAVVAVFIAAILTAFYMLASQHYGGRYSSDLFTAVAMGITGFTIPIHYFSQHGLDLTNISLQIWGYGVILSLAFTVLASFVLNRGIGIVGAQTGSVAGMLGPMITLTIAAWVLDQPFTVIHGIAITITVLGVSMVTHSERFRRLLLINN